MKTIRKMPWPMLLPAVVVMFLLLGGRLSRLRAQSFSEIDLLSQANTLYENGQYRQAVQTYQQLVDVGIENSVVYYNLGNAYFKDGDLGHAILNYRRAERLSPRDSDVRANLTLARMQTLDKYGSDNSSAVARLVTVARSWLTLNETAALALGLWMALALLFLGYRHGREGYLREGILYASILTFLLLVGGIVSLGSLLYVENTRPAAVIVAQEIGVMSGPGDQYVTEFALHSGAEVRLVERRSDWVRLTLPGDQLEGWVPESAVSAVAKAE